MTLSVSGISPKASNKIGVFDSGIGGLSIAAEIKHQLPDIPMVYLADSAHNPYGEMSVERLTARCFEITRQLISLGCRLIVVACNTATVNCIDALRQEFDVPFVGVEPGIKPALALSSVGSISVLATTKTLQSSHYCAAKLSYAPQSVINDVACSGLADDIERVADFDNRLDGQIKLTPSIIAPIVSRVVAHGADVVVLGCTHYGLVKSQLISLFNQYNYSPMIVDTASAVAKQVKRLTPIVDAPHEVIEDLFLTTGSIDLFKSQMRLFWHNETEFKVASCQG